MAQMMNHIIVPIELANRLIEYLDMVQDEGPTTESGWKSNKLKDTIREFQSCIKLTTSDKPDKSDHSHEIYSDDWLNP